MLKKDYQMLLSLHRVLVLRKAISFFSFYLGISFLFTFPVMAEKADSLFLTDDIINLELRADFSAIDKTRAGNPEYYDGKMIFYEPDGTSSEFSIRVIARGNFRRDPENCYFPPLYLYFVKEEVRNTIFKNQDKLKLVTPCQREEEVIEEYLIYRMYNEVTEQSMRTRLAKVRYFDTGSGRELFESYSFFLEEKEYIAERNNAVLMDKFIMPEDLNRDNFMKLAFFQYLTGNIDWYIQSRKNIIIMEPEDGSSPPFAVPYDFDLSGFVNPHYSKPAGVPAQKLSEKRIFRGLCYSDEELRDLFTFYRNLKPSFESVIYNNELLSKSGRRQLLRYLNYSYAVINSRDLVKREFLTVCQAGEYKNVSEVVGPVK